MRIAIIGSGISGVTCAHILRRRHDVTLFEADDRPGGHTNTVSLDVDGQRIDVDTGFLVYAPATYPGFVRLLDELGVASEPSDMSFSVADERSGVEWRGSTLATVFAQPRNVIHLRFLRMLVDVVRFNRRAVRLLDIEPDPELTLARFLSSRRWSRGFLEWYLLPLGASIWSSAPEMFMAMPAGMLARFFDRHGLLRLSNHPEWRTVSGGARHYVDAALAPLVEEGRLRLGTPVTQVRRSASGAELHVNDAWEPFDHVIMALHGDAALTLLTDPTDDETRVLGAFTFSHNDVTLHSDSTLMPQHHRAWASWNYHQTSDATTGVTMTYYLNLLQNLTVTTPVLETLNRDDSIDPSKVLLRLSYSHPILDTAAAHAQADHHLISGPAHFTSYCGAYWANGFHEDGVQSAIRVAQALGVDW